MRVIADQLEVLVDEIEQGAHLRIELNARQRTRLPPELLVGLVEMVEIEVHVAEGVDQLARNELRHLRHHHGEQRIRGDVEGHTEEDIRRALIELAEELALRHIELEQAMAGWERHLVELADVPGAHHVAAGIRVALQVFHDLRHLVDLAAVRRRPETPLPAIDWPEIAVFVRPLVPNCHAMLVEVTHVGRALQEPEQFVDDRFHVQLLGGDERKTLRQVKAHLAAEQAQGTGSGAVPFPHAEVANLRKKVEILAQKPVLFRPPGCPGLGGLYDRYRLRRAIHHPQSSKRDPVMRRFLWIVLFALSGALLPSAAGAQYLTIDDVRNMALDRGVATIKEIELDHDIWEVQRRDAGGHKIE